MRKHLINRVIYSKLGSLLTLDGQQLNLPRFLLDSWLYAQARKQSLSLCQLNGAYNPSGLYAARRAHGVYNPSGLCAARRARNSSNLVF